MTCCIRWTYALVATMAGLALALSTAGTIARNSRKAATGPLRTHPGNPRYFTDGTKGPDGRLKTVYLTGSHTWGNLVSDSSAPKLDWAEYLAFLKKYNHNFIRLWARESVGMSPLPYLRTGPGVSADGKPKLDLSRLNPDYFDHLRSRAIEAGRQGIYVGVMLFRPGEVDKEEWDVCIYNAANSVQGVSAYFAREVVRWDAFNLSVPEITACQETYLRKVIDTLNDLDNVLYEIGNEGDLTSVEWQYHFVKFIREYEAGKPKQHPIGMTAVFNVRDGSWATDDSVLFKSPADWISPVEAYKDDPPAADGKKVIIADVDHIWPTAPHRGWTWKCFLRGSQPILMDWYCYGDPTWTSSAEQEAMRKQMGYTLEFARKMNLAAMTPRSELASTKYCLANPGSEYLVYQPGEGEFTVQLADGPYTVQWFDTDHAKTVAAGAVAGGGRQTFKPPFDAPAVLYLKAKPK